MTVCYLLSDDLSSDFQNRKSLGVKLNFLKAPAAWPPQARVECKPGLSETRELVLLESLLCARRSASCFASVMSYRLSRLLR